jgi:hypothetical protein
VLVTGVVAGRSCLVGRVGARDVTAFLVPSDPLKFDAGDTITSSLTSPNL